MVEEFYKQRNLRTEGFWTDHRAGGNFPPSMRLSTCSRRLNSLLCLVQTVPMLSISQLISLFKRQEDTDKSRKMKGAWAQHQGTTSAQRSSKATWTWLWAACSQQPCSSRGLLDQVTSRAPFQPNSLKQ